jgi:2-C-methyl-D-erythritol 4-phosphate cytidylyltransferase
VSCRCTVPRYEDEHVVGVRGRGRGSIPALPIPDVVRSGSDGLETVSGALIRVQTPQAFRALPLLRAYRAAERDGFEGTDTSSCIETFTDVEVRTFNGHEHNLKVTYAHDIAVAERLLTNRGTR